MKDLFLKKSEKMISDAYDYIKSLSSVKAGSFESSETAVIMVDIINGFINEGALHDNNIAGIIPQVEKLLKYAVANDIPQWRLQIAIVRRPRSFPPFLFIVLGRG